MAPQQLRYRGPALREGDPVVVLRVEDLGGRSMVVLGPPGEVDHGPATATLEYRKTERNFVPAGSSNAAAAC
jgi:hypothetical protein